MSASQTQKATDLQRLNREGTYALPNAWDVGSAVLIARAGASVIATTSAGVSWALGKQDGENLDRQEMLDVIRFIVAAVDVPVSADIEGGYGPTPADVAQTIQGVVETGAVGINIEDSGAPGGSLFSIDEHAVRLRAARDAAADGGLAELAINARTDVYLFQVGAPESRLAETIDRAHAFAEAGADTLFVPGVADLAVIESLVERSPIPINIMTGPGGPTVPELAKVGVRRVSLGPAITYAAYSLVWHAAREMIETGTYTRLSGVESYEQINDSFTKR
jgi:2-methylisocitrate lyase-like PEP mutase family enzyme